MPAILHHKSQSSGVGYKGSSDQRKSMASVHGKGVGRMVCFPLNHGECRFLACKYHHCVCEVLRGPSHLSVPLAEGRQRENSRMWAGPKCRRRGIELLVVKAGLFPCWTLSMTMCCDTCSGFPRGNVTRLCSGAPLGSGTYIPHRTTPCGQYEGLKRPLIDSEMHYMYCLIMESATGSTGSSWFIRSSSLVMSSLGNIAAQKPKLSSFKVANSTRAHPCKTGTTYSGSRLRGHA